MNFSGSNRDLTSEGERACLAEQQVIMRTGLQCSISIHLRLAEAWGMFRCSFFSVFLYCCLASHTPFLFENPWFQETWHILTAREADRADGAAACSKTGKPH